MLKFKKKRNVIDDLRSAQETFWRRYFGAVARAKAAARRTKTVCDRDGRVLVPPAPEEMTAGQ